MEQPLLQDVSLELDYTFWETWYYHGQVAIPWFKDSCDCHLMDALQLYCGGWEL